MRRTSAISKNAKRQSCGISLSMPDFAAGDDESK